MKLLFMMLMFISYLLIALLVNSNLSFVIEGFSAVKINGGDESSWDYLKFFLLLFTAWYIRLRHLLNKKWKYAVDQYNNALRIKYSNREAGPVSHHALILNLCLSILHNGLWGEKDLRFLILGQDYLHNFKQDFIDSEILDSLDWNSKDYTVIAGNIERMLAYLRKTYTYRNID